MFICKLELQMNRNKFALKEIHLKKGTFSIFRFYFFNHKLAITLYLISESISKSEVVCLKGGCLAL